MKTFTVAHYTTIEIETRFLWLCKVASDTKNKFLAVRGKHFYCRHDIRRKIQETKLWETLHTHKKK